MSLRRKRGGSVSGNPIKFLQYKELYGSHNSFQPSGAASSFLSHRLDQISNLYQKDLYAHYGCVNAIEFSNEGDLLISGLYLKKIFNNFFYIKSA